MSLHLGKSKAESEKLFFQDIKLIVFTKEYAFFQ